MNNSFDIGKSLDNFVVEFQVQDRVASSVVSFVFSASPLLNTAFKDVNVFETPSFEDKCGSVRPHIVILIIQDNGFAHANTNLGEVSSRLIFSWHHVGELTGRVSEAVEVQEDGAGNMAVLVVQESGFATSLAVEDVEVGEFVFDLIGCDLERDLHLDIFVLK